jgi:hypothetical protein
MGQCAFPTIVVCLVIGLIAIEMKLVCKRIAVELDARRKPDAVGHAHRPHTERIILFSALGITLVGSLARLTIQLRILERSHLFKHRFQAALSHMDLAFKFAALVLPSILLLCPKLVHSLRVRLLGSDLFLGRFQPFFNIAHCFHSFVPLSSKFAQC